MEAGMKLTLALVTGLVVCVATTHVPAQDKQDKKDPPDFSAPGPEHKILEGLAGTYDAKVKAFLEPGKPPEESTGLMKRKMLMGGRYLQEDYDGKLGPDSFTGLGIIGFDKIKKKYVMSWIDSMSTGFMTSEGTYDAAKKTLTYESEDFDPATGKKMKGRDILRIDSENQQTFEMYRQPPEEGAKEAKVLEIIYIRKK
jgi:Protein of unknown function (DUF1579)